MRIAISFWTFFNISSDKTDPFAHYFATDFTLKLKRFTLGIVLVKHRSCLHHTLSCTYS